MDKQDMITPKTYAQQKNNPQRNFIKGLSILLIIGCFLSACVVKEELDNTYNQAHLGLNQWSLLEQPNRSYLLIFDVGYLIGLVDEEGVKAIDWTYELMTKQQELISLSIGEMRQANPEKTQVFVEGRRSRTMEVQSLLQEGETYILWFTLKYNGSILHEQIFAIVAGQEGGNPDWITELIGDDIDDLSELTNSGLTQSSDAEMTEVEGSDSLMPIEAQ